MAEHSQHWGLIDSVSMELKWEVPRQHSKQD